ncbi:MAG: pimeloyl-ACP methyl ester carboxylesterase [Planctomycetota bacterium]|jgi:pimeloyl-ACP methyl ester carboxylesterase
MSTDSGYVIVEGPDKDAERQLYLVHGILGSSKNWRSFAKQLVANDPSWRVVLVDLPGHGMSRGVPGPYDLPACGAQLLEIASKVGPPRALIGHSFGGKVVCQASLQFPANPLAVVVLDCPLLAMESVTRTNSEIGKVIEVIQDVPQPSERRSDVARRFESAGFSRSLSGWMATNLVRQDDGAGYVWHFNSEAIPDLLEDYWARDYHEHLENPQKEREFLLVKAEQSDRFGPEEIAKSHALAKDGRIQWVELEKAGHWLHIDNPTGLQAILGEFLSSLY